MDTASWTHVGHAYATIATNGTCQSPTITGRTGSPHNAACPPLSIAVPKLVTTGPAVKEPA
ncbi:hypothetical protein LDL08_23560 [Nonomuraea glycinis]|uniref:Uncharacterized protein n=1 Tax=Nonomuraea glycinis TaxID=2047744 RepID=A0A918E7L6_9ACTN|nr:hypothetical protein [Nonomuraea glycinis]MCA2179170.1 hypothetical protein [Nonomuraea glycinis]GGP10235.1 hypothetical protein GCM10012278_49080 [Nonomuraea glycinis]